MLKHIFFFAIIYSCSSTLTYEELNCNYLYKEVKVKKVEQIHSNYLIHIKGKGFKGVIDAISYPIEKGNFSRISKRQKLNLFLFADCDDDSLGIEYFYSDKINFKDSTTYTLKKPRLYFTSINICGNQYQELDINVDSLNTDKNKYLDGNIFNHLNEKN